MACDSTYTSGIGPPPGYTVPDFPSLHWPPQDPCYALYDLWNTWRFTLLWTLIIYAIFHIGAALIAWFMQIGKKWSAWKYMWAVPLVYASIAGLEALLAGSIVGLIIGAVYESGNFYMSTWIPFIWGWINVLVLIVSSFTIQGGL